MGDINVQTIRKVFALTISCALLISTIIAGFMPVLENQNYHSEIDHYQTNSFWSGSAKQLGG